MRIISLLFFVFLILPFTAHETYANVSSPEAYFSDRKVKVLTTTYYAHKWSDIGRYKKVSEKGKRLGNYVALNFLPGGSIIMIPELFKTTTFEVADTLGGSGRGYFHGKAYWKVDILRNKAEYIDDYDYPLDLYIVKYNKQGPVKNRQVRKNSLLFAD